MKFNFKIQSFQTDAVNAVADVFSGQPKQGLYRRRDSRKEDEDGEDYGNARVELSDDQLLENIRKAQMANGIKPSPALVRDLGAASLDVEMETGTGKTYVYIKTMFELNRRYGWGRFVVVAPSIAVREGMRKSFEVTQGHFMEQYGLKARHFIYNPLDLSRLDHFAKDPGINVMIINIQAFATSLNEAGNAEGRGGDRAARIIYSKRDDFGTRRPIDAIKAGRPVVILDEPQKMRGQATQKALKNNFNPLFSVNYSATHKTAHNLVYALDALDAFNKKLVKKIEVKGFEIKSLPGASKYLYLEEIVLDGKRPPRARLELEVSHKSGIRRETHLFGAGDKLATVSGGLTEYRDLSIAEVDPFRNVVVFSDGAALTVGNAGCDVNAADLRRIQIRETIRSHFDKEETLFGRGIKCLSLFFIDEVAKYRQYDADGAEHPGEYGEMFEQEYRLTLNERLPAFSPAYQAYLRGIAAGETHRGYFSVDRRGRAVNSPVKRGDAFSDDISAYELILKNKERLLALAEPTRFIFSHSALREGWDNPNVFQICALKHSDNAAAKRQEVGRGLRLCVDQAGDRQDAAACGETGVHAINTLTVIAGESYAGFVADLQRKIREDLRERPNKPDAGHLRLDKMLANGHDAKIRNKPFSDNFRKRESRQAAKARQAGMADFDSAELVEKCTAALNANLRIARLSYTLIDGEQIGAEFKASRGRGKNLEPGQDASVKYDLVGQIAAGATLTRRTAAAILNGLAPGKLEMLLSSPEEFIRKVVEEAVRQKADICSKCPATSSTASP